MQKSKTHSKRILKVTIKRMYDESPDTSWLGEYSDKCKSEFSIDRAHAEDCAENSPEVKQASEMLERAMQTVADIQTTVDYDSDETEWEALEDAYRQLESFSREILECDCRGGDMERGQYRYFNPSFNYVDASGKSLADNTPEEVREYVRQDYKRMESLNRRDFCFIGIRAEADISLGVEMYRGSFATQTIISGGLWGIESDSDSAYLESVEQEELSDLKAQLLALGFSKRAIAVAFKTIEHKTE